MFGIAGVLYQSLAYTALYRMTLSCRIYISQASESWSKTPDQSASLAGRMTASDISPPDTPSGAQFMYASILSTADWVAALDLHVF